MADILLDTGCSRTLVRSDLASADKLLEGEAVTIRCAHGDTVLYPLAEVSIEVEGVPIQLEAAVSEMLTVSVLGLGELCSKNSLLYYAPMLLNTFIMLLRILYYARYRHYYAYMST